eukprot:CFRG5198T1
MFKFICGASRPKDLGVKDGQFKPVPSSPNCVSSMAPKEDKHYIDPIAYTQDTGAEALAHLKSVLEKSKAGSNAILVGESATDSYLHYEYTTPIMGFVDDFEFYVDEAAKVIHVRSASRVGYSDAGANKARVNSVRKAFTA